MDKVPVVFGMLLHDPGHAAERDEGLVSGLYKQELERVVAEGNGFQSGEDSTRGGATSDCKEVNE